METVLEIPRLLPRSTIPSLRRIRTATLVSALLCLAAGCLVAEAQTIPLTTVQNSTLAVPADSLAAVGLAGSTNLTGPELMLSAVMSSTTQGGSASLNNSQQWGKQYNAGYGSYQNAAYAICSAGHGRVVVTGPSYALTTGYDFVTIAYAADGTPLWTNRFDGPVHGSDTSYYVASSSSAATWVAGQSMRTATNSELTDAVLINYASNGVPLWTNRYNSFDTNGAWPSALAVDVASNAYLAVSSAYWSGHLGTPVEDAIIKYDAQGNMVWTKHFLCSAPYSGSGVHEIRAIALDGAGNLLAAGDNSTLGTSIVKYAGDGSALWTNSDSLWLMDGLTLLCVDRQGSAILTVEQITNYPVNYVVMKRSANGATLWTNTLVGPLYDGGNVPQTICDPAGNVFLIGAQTRATWPGSYQILKMSSNGVPLWTNQNIVLGPTNCMIGPTAVDNAGNLYLTGHVPSATNGYADIVVFKYSGDGQSIWSSRYNGIASKDDYPFGVVVDGTGDVYVTGQSDRSTGDRDLLLVKYADQLIYRPPRDFTGSDHILYKLADSLGNSATGSVEVVVAPGAFQFTVSAGATRLTATGLVFKVDGAPGTNPVVIEVSTDLMKWQPMLTNAPSNGTVQLLDSAAPALPKRFYRAVQQQ